MINIENIKYSESKNIGNRHSFYQDILFDDKIIGALVTTNTNILKSVKEVWQLCTEYKHKEQGDNYYITEDEGFIFLQFYSLEKFVNFLNKKMKNKFDRF